MEGKNVTHARLIEEWTDDILRQYEQLTGRLLGLPVPVLDIAERLFALRCDIEDLRGKLWGASGILIADKRWILLNRRQGSGRCNFTLAHELAHWLIDCQEVGQKRHGLEYITGLRCKNPAERERRANRVASALLMPQWAILKEAGQHECLTEHQVSEMAAKFGVSYSAMQIRLEELCDDLRQAGISLVFTQRAVVEAPSMGRRHKTDGESKPKAAMIKVRYDVLDHSLYRQLASYRERYGRLYLVVDDQDNLGVDALLALDCVDGLLSITHECFAELEREGQASRHHATIFKTITQGNWLEQLQLNGPQGQSKATLAHVVSFRADDQLQSETFALLDVGRYIEPRRKLPYRDDARRFVRNAQKEGKRVVIVTGCFDLLTSAHVQFLRHAKAAGDALVVGLEDDTRVRAFKGPLRPVNAISQRVEVIEALECVDYTFVIYGSPRVPLKHFYTRLHKAIGADVLAVTEDDPYLSDRRDEIEAGGGRLLVINHFDANSTTSLIRHFLSEIEYSDMLLVSKRQLAAYVAEYRSNWRQLALPLDWSDCGQSMTTVPGQTPNG